MQKKWLHINEAMGRVEVGIQSEHNCTTSIYICILIHTICSDLLLEINPIFQILYKLVENLKFHFMLNFILTA